MISRLRAHPTVVLATLAALLVVAPVVTDPANRALGLRFVDGFGTHWWFWYVGEVIAGRQGLLHTDLFFYPTGKDVFAHTGGNLLDGLLAWPLRELFGATAGYNLWIAVVVATNFGAGSVLGRTVTGERGWPAGVALALNPFVLQELHGGRPTQAWLAFPALALAGVWGAKTPMRAIATGLAVAAAGWVYWYAGLVVGLLAVATGLGRLVVSPTRRRDTALLGLAALVAAVAVAPAVLAMQDQLRAGAVPGLLAMDGTGLLAPLAMRTQEGEAAGLHVLAPLAGVAGALFEEDGKLHFSAGPPSLAFAGVGAAVIAGVLAARARRPAALVLALTLAALSFLAAAGPAIVVGDTFLANRPWIWAAAHVDLIRRWWWPGRAIFGVFLAIAAVVPWLGRVRGLPWLFAAASVVELWRTAQLPLDTWDAHPPAPLVCLADAAPGAVIDLPFLSDQRNLWFQTIHHQPLLSGMLVKQPAFGSRSALQLRKDNAFLDLVLDYGELQVTRDPAFDDAGRIDLLARGFRYVVVDETRFEGAAAGRGGGLQKGSAWPRARRLLAPALGEPAADRDGVAVYTLDRSPLPCP